MAVATKVIALTTTPIDLAADVDVAAEVTSAGKATLTIQNVSTGKYVFVSERATAPADGSREGFILGYRDSGTVAIVRGGPSFWAWSSTSANLALTGADT